VQNSYQCERPQLKYVETRVYWNLYIRVGLLGLALVSMWTHPDARPYDLRQLYTDDRTHVGRRRGDISASPKRRNAYYH